MSTHEPPVALAKVNADEELNKALATEYEVKGYPTIKILRNKGKNIQDFNGPREAEGIVEYLKKQSGPASAEIKSADDAGRVVVDKKIAVVSFMLLALFEWHKYHCMPNYNELFAGWCVPKIRRRGV